MANRILQRLCRHGRGADETTTQGVRSTAPCAPTRGVWADCITTVIRRDRLLEVQRVGVIMDICSEELGVNRGEPARAPAREAR